MAFIEVEPTELFGAANRIQGALPTGTGGGIGGAAGAAGRGDVTAAIEEFLDRWSYGVSSMNQDALHLASLLGRAGQLYAKTEDGIAGAER